MAQTDEPEIQQLIPAPNWFVVFRLDDPPYYEAYPLVCWALVRDPPASPGALHSPYVLGYYADSDLGVRGAEDQYWLDYATGQQLTDPAEQARWTETGRRRAEPTSAS